MIQMTNETPARMNVGNAARAIILETSSPVVDRVAEVAVQQAVLGAR